MILAKGHMVARGELWGENYFGSKPPLILAQLCIYVRSLPKATSKEGPREKDLVPTLIFSQGIRRRSWGPSDLY
jgi:hypothetical protein